MLKTLEAHEHKQQHTQEDTPYIQNQENYKSGMVVDIRPEAVSFDPETMKQDEIQGQRGCYASICTHTCKDMQKV